MTDLEKAARQALDALEAGSDVAPIFWGETVDALRAALSQQAEPVVCVCGDPTSLGIVHRTDRPCYAQQAEPDAVLAEREACANIAREVGTNTLPEDFALDRCYEIESAIRARGQQAEPVWELGVAGRLSAEAAALAGCERRSEPEPDHTTENAGHHTAGDRRTQFT